MDGVALQISLDKRQRHRFQQPISKGPLLEAVTLLEFVARIDT